MADGATDESPSPCVGLCSATTTTFAGPGVRAIVALASRQAGLILAECFAPILQPYGKWLSKMPRTQKSCPTARSGRLIVVRRCLYVQYYVSQGHRQDSRGGSEGGKFASDKTQFCSDASHQQQRRQSSDAADVPHGRWSRRSRSFVSRFLFHRRQTTVDPTCTVSPGVRCSITLQRRPSSTRIVTGALRHGGRLLTIERAGGQWLHRLHEGPGESFY